jgi:hypothetical protein
LPDVAFDGHGEPLNTIFRLRCRCGSDRGFVDGYSWYKPEFRVTVFLSPLTFQCAACGRVAELLDTDRHGYNPVVCGDSATVRAEGVRAQYRCERCGPVPFEVFARFEYLGDLFTEDYDDCRGKEQDCFSWFTAVGKCTGCSRLMTVADFECA